MSLISKRKSNSFGGRSGHVSSVAVPLWAWLLAESRRWCSDLTVFFASVADDLGVDRTRDAVMQFRVQFGQWISCSAVTQLVVWMIIRQMLTVIDRSVGDVPDSGRFDDVADHELLDGLVFGHTSGTVSAPDGLHMSATVLCSTVVPTFGGLVGQHNTCLSGIDADCDRLPSFGSGISLQKQIQLKREEEKDVLNTRLPAFQDINNVDTGLVGIN